MSSSTFAGKVQRLRSCLAAWFRLALASCVVKLSKPWLASDTSFATCMQHHLGRQEGLWLLQALPPGLPTTTILIQVSD